MVKVFMKEDDIINAVAECLVKAGSTFRSDQKDAYNRAIAKEGINSCCWVLKQVLENALVAEKKRSPLCDDTGIPHVFLEIGPTKNIDGDFLSKIELGIEVGLRLLPGRPMAIMGNDMERIEQSGGLNPDSGAVKIAPIIIRRIEDDIRRLTILLLGGGPAIRGITYRIFHKHSIDVVIDEIVKRAVEGVSKLGCTPCTLALGIGRSQFEATALMIEAMAKGNYEIQSEFERTITERVNKSNVGALGLGGNLSVLATFAKIGSQRASGVRIVALRPCCCFEPRIASIEL